MESPNLVQINLLPPEQRPQPARWMAKAAILMAVVMITAGSIVASIVVNVMVLQQRAAVNAADRQVMAMKDELAEVAMLEEKERTLQTKQKIIDELIVKRMEWAPKLNLISDLLPDDIWLERLYVKTDTKKVRVRPKPTTSRTATPQRPIIKTLYTDYLYLDAITHKIGEDARLIAQMIKNLQQSPAFMGEDFEYVDHKHSELGPWQQRDKESPQVWRFQLECKMKSRQDLDEEA
jgi:Tfp pilus assembly protein PilN